MSRYASRHATPSLNHSSLPDAIPSKNYETIDISEYPEDYDNREWFKDPPPGIRPRDPSPPEPMGPEFIPTEEAKEKNEILRFAFQVAPNVCWSRFKQFGQIGVLAWTYEFKEMIDMFEGFVFEGHLFVQTRHHALRACDELLDLPLEIDIKLILMLLTRQVKRIRNFLDPNTVYDDWPAVDFLPMPYVYMD